MVKKRRQGLWLLKFAETLWWCPTVKAAVELVAVARVAVARVAVARAVASLSLLVLHYLDQPNSRILPSSCSHRRRRHRLHRKTTD